MRYFRLWNANNLTNFALFQVALFQDTDYLNTYFAPRKKFICVLLFEVSEYIATAFFKKWFLYHASFSSNYKQRPNISIPTVELTLLMLLSASFCRHEIWLSAPNVLRASIDIIRGGQCPPTLEPRRLP